MGLLLLLLFAQDRAAELESQGRYAEAEMVLRQSGDLDGLARNLFAQNKLTESAAVVAQLVPIAEKKHGAESIELLPTLALAARVHQALADTGKAEVVLLRMLSIREKAQGPEHPDVAAEEIALARFYLPQKRAMVAEARLNRALAILGKNFGGQDQKLLAALDPLGSVQAELGRFPDAEQTLRRALAIRERATGPTHAEVAPTLDNLATVLYKQKKFADAELVSERALAIWKGVVGEEHALLATSYDNVAVAQSAQGNNADAEENYRQALFIREAGAARSIYNLALVAAAQGKLADAEALYAAGMGIVDRLPPGSPLQEAILKHYIGVLRKSKKEAAAAKIEERFATSIQTSFEGGRLGKIEKLGETHFRVHVAGEADQDKRNRQANWYYFRLDNAAGREVIVDLASLPGEYNYVANRGAVTEDTLPVFSYDQRTWKHFDKVEYDAQIPRLRLRFTPAAHPVWIAHVPPYTNQDLARLLREFARHPHLERAVIGKSAEGRELLLLTVTNPAVAAENKKVIWLMFRQHSWEAGSSWAGEGALRFLLSPGAASIRDAAIVKIFPMCDPDGVARGGVRFNVHGYDLNRNWDAVDAKLMPEIAAQRKAVLDWVDAGRRLDVFLSLHNTETAEYLEGPPGPLRDRLFRLLAETTSFHPSRPPSESGVSTTPGRKGRMTVVQGLHNDRKIPAFLIEQRIAFNRKLGRLPTIDDRLKFGGELVQALFGGVSGQP